MAVTGDLPIRGAAGWDKVAGNNAATRKYLYQLGDGDDVTETGWDAVGAGDMTDFNSAVDARLPALASQAEAEAGSDNAKIMTALRVAQAIDAQTPAVASQAEAEAGSDNAKVMTALRVAQAIEALADDAPAVASQAEAEAGSDNAKMMTALRVAQAIEALADDAPAVASQAEAEAGSDNAKMMTALRVAQAIAALAGEAAPVTRTINYVLDGGGEALTAGDKGSIVLDFAGEIEQVTLLADAVGDLVVDIRKVAFEDYDMDDHPVAGDSICDDAKPTLDGAIAGRDSTLTGWTTTFAGGDVLQFYVDSAADITRATVALKVSG